MDSKKLQPRALQLLTTGSNVEIFKHVASLTVETAQKGEQLSKLKRENEDAAVAALSVAITNLNDSINIGSKMNEVQILETAIAILSEYWTLKIDEVLNCFKMVKAGKMGKIYGLDQPTIMGYLNTYDTEIKAGYYAENEPTHTNRYRENNEPKHISLSVEDLKKLKK